MTHRTKTYGVRLAVYDGQKVKAELTAVGQKGEKAFKSIAASATSSSQHLEEFSHSVSSLATRLRHLSGLAASLTLAGGLTSTIQHTIEDAKALNKTAESLGLSVEALQGLRFAITSTGADYDSLVRSLDTFTSHLMEASQGSTHAASLFKDLGLHLQDTEGRLRSTDTLLKDVANLFCELEDPLERTRLALQLFGEEGTHLIGLLSQGAQGLEHFHHQAEDLGLILDKEVIQHAQETQQAFETLSRVISTTLTRAFVDVSPLLKDIAKGFAHLTRYAGIAYDMIRGEFVGHSALRPTTVKSLRDLYGWIVKSYQGSGDGKVPTSTLKRLEYWQAAVDRNTEEQKKKNQAAWAAKQAQEEIKLAEQRNQKILALERQLESQLLSLHSSRRGRIEAEHKKLLSEIEELKSPSLKDNDRLKVLKEHANTLYKARLQEREPSHSSPDKHYIESLKAEREVLALNQREQSVALALKRLSSAASAEQRREVESLSRALFDEHQISKERQASMQQGLSLTLQYREAEESYGQEVEKLNALLKAGAITQETYTRAQSDAFHTLLKESEHWAAGASRALVDYNEEASNAARQFESVTRMSLKGCEDAFINWAETGKLQAKDLFGTLIEEALRASSRMVIIKPLTTTFQSVFSSLVPVAHRGGVIGKDAFPHRSLPGEMFNQAPRFHQGGLVKGEVPIIAKEGEVIFTPHQMKALGNHLKEKPSPAVNVVVHIDNRMQGASIRAEKRANTQGGAVHLDVIVEQVENGLIRNIGRGEGLAPLLERRYGLNPASGLYGH